MSSLRDAKNRMLAIWKLEELIDRFSFDIVIDILAEIAALKADHLRTNWQDEARADRYEALAVKLRSTRL